MATDISVKQVIGPIFFPRLNYVRDRIVVNAAFANEIQAELAFRKTRPGTILCFAAREIVHASNYEFKLVGYPLVFVADAYDGNGGSVDTTDYESVAVDGSAGGVGAMGHTGATGGLGGDGRPASPITLVAQRVTDARLIATGRPGGNGGAGGAGGKGADGVMDFGTGPGPVQKPECLSAGGNGGNGGNGGAGGTGGNGGAITVHMVSKQGVLNLNAKPGPGGKGGAAGEAGKGGAKVGKCPAGKPGKPGAPGPAGKLGAAGKVTETALAAEAWWKAAATVLGAPLAQDWASYRTRVGEYKFRTYRPGIRLGFGLRTPSILGLARQEFEAALAMAKAMPAKVTASRAGTLVGYLDQALTPLGIGYQQDLRPDFQLYEEFITDYQGRRDALFGETLQLLLDIKSKSDKGQLAATLREHAAGMSGAAQKDSLLADSEREQANHQLQEAKNRLFAIQAKLESIRKQAKERAAEFDFGDVVKAVAEVVGAVIAIVGAVYSAGTSVAAYVALIGTVAATAADVGEAAADIGTWVDMTDPANPKPTEAGDKVIGDLKNAIDHTAKLVDKGKAVAQLFEGESDDEFDQKEREWLVKAFDATVEVNLRTIDVEQSKLAADSAKQKWDVYQADTQSLQDLKSGFDKDMDVLVSVTRALIRQFQTYVDHFIAYGFCRDRAFDLYTLPKVPRAPRFPFDYGYLHPDVEENAFFALARKDSSRVLGLLEKYVTSLAKFEPAELRKEYDDYWTSLAFDGNVAVSVTDPSVLQSLKGSGTASFQVELADFDPQHTELKIGRAEVALIGAKTNPNHKWVQIELEHCGPSTNRRSDGNTVSIEAPRRIESSPAQIEGINPQDLDEADKQSFWGRSPAARWRVSISPQSATAAGLDLSGVTEVQLSVKYAYYNPAAAAKKIAAAKKFAATKKTAAARKIAATRKIATARKRTANTTTR